MIFLNIGILVLVAGGVWWLTGLDKTGGGESKRSHHVSRTVRSLMVLLLAAAFLLLVEQPDLGAAGIPMLIVIPISIGIILRSGLSEILTQGFLRIIDPELHDKRPFDPGKSRHYMDKIAHLIHNGRREEAVKLCEELKRSGEVDISTLEMTLEFLGVRQDRVQTPKPLAEAARLREQGKFAEAEQRLKSLLAKNPADSGATMILVRLYAQDLRQPAKAHEVLQQLEKQPHASTDHIEFARRSIGEWSRPKLKTTEPAAPPESVDVLLAQGFGGTAIELLEEKIKAQPQDFELRLKLAEIFAAHFGNFPRADKIIRQMEAGSNFSPKQLELANAKLKEWRKTGLMRAT